MATMYLEPFLLQNAIVDAGLLCLMARWRGERIRPVRLALGSLLGTLYALAATLTGGVLASLPVILIVSLVMCRTALPGGGLTATAQGAGAVWTFSLLLGGAAALGLSVLLAGIATGFFGCSLLKRKRLPPQETVTLTVRQGEVSREITALVDSGCRALDVWSGLPVVLVPEGLFTPEPGRVLSIRTAAGGRLLPCFAPDAVLIDGVPVKAVAALAPKESLPGALVPAALLGETSSALRPGILGFLMKSPDGAPGKNTRPGRKAS